MVVSVGDLPGLDEVAMIAWEWVENSLGNSMGLGEIARLFSRISSWRRVGDADATLQSSLSVAMVLQSDTQNPKPLLPSSCRSDKSSSMQSLHARHVENWKNILNPTP